MILFLSLSLAAEPPEVQQIRQEWTSVQKQLASDQSWTLVVDWNADDAPWPAVGIYRRKLKVYRINGEEEPYPHQILKIVTESAASVREERREYLYAHDGALRFAFVDHNHFQPLRAYWDGERVVRLQIGETPHDPPEGWQAELAGRLREDGTAVFELARALMDKAPAEAAVEDFSEKLPRATNR